MSLVGAEIKQQEKISVETKASVNPMEEAMKMIGDVQSGQQTKSTKGCFWLSDSGGHRLFICANNLESSNSSLFLFSYKWKEKETKKVVKITQKIGHSNSQPILMQFENGDNENLPREASTSLASLWKEWKGSDFSTSSCKLTGDNGSPANYSLTCPNPKTQPQTPSTWTKKVSRNDMILSDNSSTKK